MCGIAASFNAYSASELTRKSLQKVQHRGGSTFEVKDFESASMGTNRLPIVGRLSGIQPAHNEDGSVFAVQNGEIFNFKDLRIQLELAGHIFNSDSDTEVLVHGYEEWGPKLVNKIDSEMYAFVVYCTKTKEIFAARDPLGVKPLYFAITKNKEIFFASELKQLASIENIDKINEFPAGHYYFNGTFKKYFKIGESEAFLTEEQALYELDEAIVDSVRKRVDTDLPIGVFLSGGVDSSLVMELASRFHPNVTAIILGKDGSPDYEFALRLCKERGYKYHLVSPDIDFEQELSEILYYLETYEPLIVRQSFANWICSREAQKLGLSVILAGEGPDELFAGYNEFSALSDNDINKGCELLTSNLSFGHLKRVDRCAMRFTVEVRCPLLDTNLVKIAFRIKGALKLFKKDHRVTTKYIFRKVASKYLPDYIAWRYKMPFANGAGMDVGYNYKSGDGILGSLAMNREVKIEAGLVDKFKLETNEEKYYFQKFHEFRYTKLFGAENRIIVKDVLQSLRSSSLEKMVVAEFERLALYFPVYLAAIKKIFEAHSLDVDFIATGGDDKTYATLLNNSAQIGLSDPLFTMFEGEINKNGYGEIFAELVHSAPVVAVTYKQDLTINSVVDLRKWKVGSFQKYSTTNTLASKILGVDHVKPYSSIDLPNKLKCGEIDVAIVLLEQAFSIEAEGGRIVYDFSDHFNHYLFSGLTNTSLLPRIKKDKIKSFISAVREALKLIKNNKVESYKEFLTAFPDLKCPRRTFDAYIKFWTKSLRVDRKDYLFAHNTWKSIYPNLLKNHNIPYFRSQTKADEVLEVINNKSIRREYPFREDELIRIISERLSRKEKLGLYGFWGAGKKNKIDSHDLSTLNHLTEYIAKINKTFPFGTIVTIILADNHAECNGYEREKYEDYLSDIKKECEQRGLNTVFLSEIWKKHSLTFSDINTRLKSQPSDWWEKISIRKKLEERSREHNADQNNVLGAQKYYIMRDLEKSVLQKEFVGCIFFVHGDSLPQQIYPDVPTLYFYTEKANCSAVPWFNIS